MQSDQSAAGVGKVLNLGCPGLLELLGLGVVRGYRILSTNSHERYDSLYVSWFDTDNDLYSKEQPLGVGPSGHFGEESEPRVLEYKHDFEALVDDFSKDVKAANEISLVVTWCADQVEQGNLYLKSLLVGDEGSERLNFGATHQAFFDGHPNMTFEVIVLRDLLAFIQDPATEIARHRSVYK